MSKRTISLLAIGIFVGLVGGFIFANSVNKGSGKLAGTSDAGSVEPVGHPDAAPSSGAMPQDILAAIEQAKSEPDNFDAQVKAAGFYYQIQRYDQALDFLERAKQLKPDEREVAILRGNIYFDSGKYDQAEREYTSALAKNENDVNVRVDLGLTFIFRDKPDYDRAIKEFRRSLEIDPKQPQALQNLAVAYTKKGDAANAGKTLALLEDLGIANESIAKLRDEISDLRKK